MNLICDNCWEIRLLKLLPHLPGVNKLTHCPLDEASRDPMDDKFQTIFLIKNIWNKREFLQIDW